jgi:hypothetical protein
VERIEVYVTTEDALSEAVAERLIEEENQGMTVAVRVGRRGNSYLKQNLFSYADIARTIPLLLLTDLDRGTCPADLIDEWRGRRRLPQRMLFRVAVRETEAWLLADRKGFADFSGVPLHRIPERPELLDDPKETLLNLIRRYGKRTVREDILPKRNSSARIGLAYNQALCGFVLQFWSPERAAQAAESLRRARQRIHELRVAEHAAHEGSS